MNQEFRHGPVRLEVPDGWTAERIDEPDGWTATFQSEGSAFALVSQRSDLPDAEELAERTAATLQEEYPNLEKEPIIESVAGQQAVGYDLDFFALDLPVTCRLRCLESPDGAILVMCQACVHESDTAETEFRRLLDSVRLGERSGDT